jgi:outer membrane lipoprotein-sorting protein
MNMQNTCASTMKVRGLKRNRIASAVVLLLVFLRSETSPAAQAGNDAALTQILRQMEAVGKTFRSFQAQFSQKKYTSVLKEFDTPETGEFLYARASDGSALLRQEVVNPARRILTIKGGLATIYQPSLNQAQQVNLGKNKDKAEYLALGLGQSPGRLRETFNLLYEGEETVANAPCSKLTLRPKNPAAAAYFSSITLWIKNSSGIPIQQELLEPNGDYLLVSFTGEKLNAQISTSKFEQKLPSGVEILKLQ